MGLSAGTRLGPYEILAPLGTGGMGEVYRARDRKLDRDVAVKVLPESVAKDAEALSRFEREAKTVAALSHPNILSIFDFGKDGDISYAVMELLEGESLAARLGQGPLAPRRAAELAIQLAQGLAAAHEKGVVHRDLKPGNLWITKEGRLKILDFGLAKKVHNLRPATDTALPTEEKMPGHETGQGVVLGTLGYMSPEQVRGEPVDGRTDIFSFGVVLFEMLTGKRAFARRTPADTMAAILKEDLPEPEGTESAISPSLRRIVGHCLEKPASRRFRDAQDLAFALEDVLGSQSEPSGQIAPRSARGSNLRQILVAAGAVLAIGLAFLAGRLVKTGRRDYPRFTQVTFSEEAITRARFTHDGRSVVFMAGIGEKSKIFVQSLGDSIPRPVLEENVWLMSVSRSDELAVLDSPPWRSGASLGLCPLGGALPRILSKDVADAEWSPDGKSLAVVRGEGNGHRLEFPEGKVLARIESRGFAAPRFSPDGRTLALLKHPVSGDGLGSVVLVDAATGQVRDVGGSWAFIDGLAWRPDGGEIWFSANQAGIRSEIFAMDLMGKVRPVLSTPSNLRLEDISADGRVLLSQKENRWDILGHDAQSAETRRLSIGAGSFPYDLTRDGRFALLDDEMAPGPNYPLYLRPMDGSLPRAIGQGVAGTIAPDGKTVLVQRKDGQKDVYAFVPSAGGPETALQTGELTVLGVRWSRAEGVFALAVHGQDPPRIWKVGSEHPPRAVGPPLPPEAVAFFVPAPGAGEAIVLLRDGSLLRADLHDPGSPPKKIPWTATIEEFSTSLPSFSEDGAWCFVSPTGSPPIQVDRVNLQSGRREPYRKIDLPGISGRITVVSMSENGRMMLLRQWRLSADVFLAEGLK